MAFTSMEQSKKLAEILPPESADMFYNEEPEDETYPKDIVDTEYPMILKEGHIHFLEEYGIPCWSLAALLNYLREIDFFPEIDADEAMVTMNINYYDEEEARLLAPIHNIKVKAESFIDACYEMIIKLHEQKVL